MGQGHLISHLISNVTAMTLFNLRQHRMTNTSIDQIDIIMQKIEIVYGNLKKVSSLNKSFLF